MQRRFWVRWLAIALVLASACSRSPRLDEGPETLYRSESSITVRIVNHSRFDAAIFVAHDGARDRLGTVIAAETTTFPVRVRSLASGEFVLIADPIGSRIGASTERLSVAQGSVFTWTLESDLSRSAVLVQE